jgi:hypothetical protein
MSNDDYWDKREKLAMLLLGVAAEVVTQDLTDGISSVASVLNPKSISREDWRDGTIQLARQKEAPTKAPNIDTRSTKEKK